MCKLKFGFDLRGLLLFLAVMLPNFIWFAFPAPNDVLRGESITPKLDATASVFQVLMVAVLCLIVRSDERRFSWRRPWLWGALTFLLLYYVSWAAYYCGVTEPALLLALCALPCAAFLFYEIECRNWIALIPTAAFSVCHLAYGIVNFPL